jgi:hypothetical protein
LNFFSILSCSHLTVIHKKILPNLAIIEIWILKKIKRPF